MAKKKKVISTAYTHQLKKRKRDIRQNQIILFLLGLNVMIIGIGISHRGAIILGGITWGFILFSYYKVRGHYGKDSI